MEVSQFLSIAMLNTISSKLASVDATSKMMRDDEKTDVANKQSVWRRMESCDC